MPASKKDLKKLKQKQNVANGIGDEKGKLPSNNKVCCMAVNFIILKKPPPPRGNDFL